MSWKFLDIIKAQQHFLERKGAASTAVLYHNHTRVCYVDSSDDMVMLRVGEHLQVKDNKVFGGSDYTAPPTLENLYDYFDNHAEPKTNTGFYLDPLNKFVYDLKFLKNTGSLHPDEYYLSGWLKKGIEDFYLRKREDGWRFEHGGHIHPTTIFRDPDLQALSERALFYLIKNHPWPSNNQTPWTEVYGWAVYQFNGESVIEVFANGTHRNSQVGVDEFCKAMKQWS